MHQLSIDFKTAYHSVRRYIFYDIITEFGIPMKLVRIIELYLNETYTRVWVGKQLSDMFPVKNDLKQGQALSPLLFNSSLEYAIKSVQVNQNGLKLNVTYKFLLYGDYINILGGSVQEISSEDTGLEVNADKTKYVDISLCQNTRRSHNLKT